MSLNDSYLLSQDLTFQHRVLESAEAAEVNIHSESTTGLTPQRDSFGKLILDNPTVWAPLVSAAVATDSNVISDATANGTVVLTTGNAATQAALVTDTHINNAVSAMWNAFAVRD